MEKLYYKENYSYSYSYIKTLKASFNMVLDYAISKEFKETLIAFYNAGQSVTQLSKEYDVAPATIYKWIDIYSKSNESSVSKADFIELKRQLSKVKEE